MHEKRKMKVSFVILAAVNLFMYVNSTEKRRITCGKRSSFCLYFYLLDSLIPSQIWYYKLISGINSLNSFLIDFLRLLIYLTSNWLSACRVVKLDPLKIFFLFFFLSNFDQLAKVYWYISEERLKISKAVKSKSQGLAPEICQVLIYKVLYDEGRLVQNIHVCNPPWNDPKPLDHLSFSIFLNFLN